MGSHHNSIVLRGIWLKFGSMIHMDVKDNFTKFEQEVQCWRPGTGVATGWPRFQNLSKITTKCPFLGSLGAQDVHGGGHLRWDQPR